MTQKTGPLIAAAAALAAIPAASHAAPAQLQPIPAAASYSDLLQPIPNATERLKAADATLATPGEGQLIEAQYHHHHHHHHHNRRWYMQNGYYWYGGRWMLRPVRHHHHHHHHHGY